MPDVLSFPLVVGLSILGAWGVARTERSGAARLTILGVVSFALVVLAAQVLGTLAAITRASLLGPWSLVLAVLCLTSVVWAAVRIRRVRRTSQVDRLRDEGALAEDSAQCRPDGQASAGGGALPRRAVALIGALGLLSLANGVILGLSGPPRGWDVLTYHLPRAAAWLQHGNLGHYGFSPAFYPGNGEIAMLLTLFSGSDRLVPAVQLPFALLGAVALYGLAREIGARPRSALLAPLAFVLTPMVIFQSGIAKNDLIITGTVLAGAYLLTRALRREASTAERRLALTTGGLALGLALGAKYTILPFVAASVPAVALSLIATWGLSRGMPESERGFSRAVRTGGAWGFALREACIFVAAVTLPSVFWFAQNWIVTGNPFAPVLVKLGEWTVFEGLDVASTFGEQQLTYVLRPSGWWGFPWVDRAIVGRAIGAETEVVGTYNSSVGFGAVFAAFIVPAVVVLVHRIVKKRTDPDPRAAMLLALIVLGVAAWWFGGFHLPRYLWPVLALLYAPVALLFDRVRGRRRAALVGMLVAAALLSSLETLRIIHASDDFMSSRLPRGTANREYYHMPDLIYELPAGTRILLHEPTDDTYHRTFRYPLVGGLPGNDVVMAGDVGLGLARASDDTASLHGDIRREGIEYIFSRTLLSQPRRSWFDAFPDRYEAVIDTIAPPYLWHRTGIVMVHESGALMGYPAVTKVYRVLGH